MSVGVWREPIAEVYLLVGNGEVSQVVDYMCLVRISGQGRHCRRCLSNARGHDDRTGIPYCTWTLCLWQKAIC